MRVRSAVCLAALLIFSAPAFAGLDEGLSAFQRRDWANAAKEFRPLAAQGNAVAQGRLGYILFNGLVGPREDSEALKLYNAAGAAGDPFAQNALGNAYFHGRGVPKDPATALVWLGRAADQDYPESLHSLGEIHFTGSGVGKSEARGVEYYQRAADKGFAPSLEKLAELTWNGRSMPTDRAKAVDYARKAAEKGRPTAQFILGLAALSGEGSEKNPTQAQGWFRRAAEQGHPQGQHNLGVMLATGAGGPRNLNDAYFWLALSAERAPANLKPTYEKERDSLGAKLPPNDLAQVRAKVAAWKPPAAPGAGQQPPSAPIPAPAAAPAPAAPVPGVSPSGPQTVVRPPETSVQRGVGSTGTGFVVSKDGTVVTNAHVVEQCRTITIKPPEGPAIIASIIAKDTGDDIAVLKTALRLPDTAKFRNDKPMRSGDEVVVVGFPLSSLLSREANVTAGVISAMAGLGGDARHYQITAPVQKGNSGGPLLDMSGNIVGIVSSKLNAMKVADRTGDIPQNVNFAIKADLARKFLDRYQISYDTAPATTTLSAADVGEKATKVTVFIQCRVN